MPNEAKDGFVPTPPLILTFSFGLYKIAVINDNG